MNSHTNSQRTTATQYFDHSEQLERLRAIKETVEKSRNSDSQSARGNVPDLRAQELTLREKLERAKAEKEAKAKAEAAIRPTQSTASTNPPLKAIENTIHGAGVSAPPPPPAVNTSTPGPIPMNPYVQQWPQGISHQPPINSASNFQRPTFQFPHPFGMSEYTPQVPAVHPSLSTTAQWGNQMFPSTAVSTQTPPRQTPSAQGSPPNQFNHPVQNQSSAFQIPGLRIPSNSSSVAQDYGNRSSLGQTQNKNQISSDLPDSYRVAQRPPQNGIAPSVPPQNQHVAPVPLPPSNARTQYSNALQPKSQSQTTSQLPETFNKGGAYRQPQYQTNNHFPPSEGSPPNSSNRPAYSPQHSPTSTHVRSQDPPPRPPQSQTSPGFKPPYSNPPPRPEPIHSEPHPLHQERQSYNQSPTYRTRGPPSRSEPYSRPRPIADRITSPPARASYRDRSRSPPRRTHSLDYKPPRPVIPEEGYRRENWDPAHGGYKNFPPGRYSPPPSPVRHAPPRYEGPARHEVEEPPHFRREYPPYQEEYRRRSPPPTMRPRTPPPTAYARYSEPPPLPREYPPPPAPVPPARTYYAYDDPEQYPPEPRYREDPTSKAYPRRRSYEEYYSDVPPTPPDYRERMEYERRYGPPPPVPPPREEYEAGYREYRDPREREGGVRPPPMTYAPPSRGRGRGRGARY